MEEKNINNLRLSLKITFSKKQRRINNLILKTFLNYIINIMLIILCVVAAVSFILSKNGFLEKMCIFFNLSTALVIVIDTANSFSPISAWGRFPCFEYTALKVEQSKIIDENIIQQTFDEREGKLKLAYKTVIKSYFYVIIMELTTLFLFRNITNIVFYTCVILVGYSLWHIWLRNVFYDVNAEIKIVPKERKNTEE